MSIPSLLLLFLLIAPCVFPYTVVTTSGKRIQGRLLSDQESTILIQDASGVLISFKKELLNLEAMELENSHQASLPGKPEEHPSKKAAPSIAEVASETRKQRKGISRTLKLEDLEDTPEVSILGSESNETSTNKKTPQKEADQRWESRIVALKKEVSHLRERKINAEATCDETKRKKYVARTTPSDKRTDLLSTYKESSQCRKLEEISTQLADAEERLQDLLEEARRAGVSWRVLE